MTRKLRAFDAVEQRLNEADGRFPALLVKLIKLMAHASGLFGCHPRIGVARLVDVNPLHPNRARIPLKVFREGKGRRGADLPEGLPIRIESLC